MRRGIKTGSRPKSNSVSSQASVERASLFNISQEFQLFVKINANRAADLVQNGGAEATKYSSKKSVNPLLIVVMNDIKKQTSRKLNTSQPSWDDELVIPLKLNSYSQLLILTVWDKHKRYRNYLGELRLWVKDIFNLGSASFKSWSDLKWYKLYSNSEYHSFVTGSLLLSFELIVKRKKVSRKQRKQLKHSEDERAIESVPESTDDNDNQCLTGREHNMNDLYNKVDDLNVSEEYVVSDSTEAEKAVLLKNWMKSLIDPEFETSTKPDEQGFYRETYKASNTLVDVSDMESLVEEPTSGTSFLKVHNPHFNGVSSSPAEDDASSISEMSMISSDGGLATESDSVLLSTGDEVKTKSPKRSKLRKLALKRSSLFQDKFALSNREVLGVMFIEIVSCSDLPPLKSFTRASFDMDPFVVVTFGKKTFRTSWKRHTLNPIFNERVAFEILPHESKFNIQFSILDKDHFSFHDDVGHVTIPIQDITQVSTALPMVASSSLGTGIPRKSVSYMPLNLVDGGFTTGDNDSPSHSSIRILDDDNLIPSIRKKKFRKKVTLEQGDTSSFKVMNLKLDLYKDKFKEKYNPELKIRVRFETYENLRRRFWAILLEQYNLNDKENAYDYFELIALLDTLGCGNSDELVATFYEKLGRSTWGGDLLSHSEIIDCLEEHVNSAKSEGEYKIFEIDKCPICLNKRLNKKIDRDIITHVAICASKDWSIVNKLLVATYTTPQSASRKWFSKVLIKMTYGKYVLGGNNANILVQDRNTGLIMEEKMGVYVRLGIRLLYKGLDKAKTKRIRILLKKLSVKQGIKFDNYQSKNDIDSFIKFHKLNLSECLETNPSHYASFNEFFYRRLKQGARPIDCPDDSQIVVSPADCRCTAFTDINNATELWIKGKNFTIAKLFNGNFNNFENTDIYSASKCSIGIFRLAPQDYHRFHCPVDGIIQNIKNIDGEYYTVNPMAIRSELDVFGENVRAIIPIKTENFGTMVMVAVGAMMVGSIVLTVGEDDVVKRGDEIGYFKFGGSTIILLFEKRFFKFDSDLVNNSKSCIETLIRVGQSIGHSPDVKEHKPTRIDFAKQTKDFKLNLIRVLTGGDLNNASELSNWESSNIKITTEDMDELVQQQNVLDDEEEEEEEEDNEFYDDEESFFDEEGSVNSDNYNT